MNRLDTCHARARRFAQTLSVLGDSLGDESRDLVREAELLQAVIAEKLHRAWVLQRNGAL